MHLGLALECMNLNGNNWAPLLPLNQTGSQGYASVGDSHAKVEKRPGMTRNLDSEYMSNGPVIPRCPSRSLPLIIHGSYYWYNDFLSESIKYAYLTVKGGP